MKPQRVKVQRADEPSSWIKDWYIKQKQKRRLVEAYENHEVEIKHGQKMSCLV